MKKVILLLMVFSILEIYADIDKNELHKASKSQQQNLWKNEVIPGEFTVMFKQDAAQNEIDELMNRTNCYIDYTSPYLGFHRVIIPVTRNVKEMVTVYNKERIVQFSEPNVIAHAFWNPNDEFFSYQWHFDSNHLNMPAAWDIQAGGNQNVIVAVIDSGVAYENYAIPVPEQFEVISYDGMYHVAPDLASTNFVAGYDFVHNDSHPNDQNGHGTHCSGTIAQNTNNSIGVAGMAFNTTIMPVQVLNYAGSGSTQGIADGIAFAVQNGAHILSMSLGGQPGDPTGWEVVHTALINAVSYGVTPIIAAGNSGDGVLSYPAAYDECISVASTDYDNDLAPYTQYGPGLDISAPGGNTSEDLNSDGYLDGILQNTYADGLYDPPHNVSSFDYVFYQGTSMATPHVAGLCALLFAQGIVGFNDIRSAIYETAYDLGSAGYDEMYGWGMINPVAALNWSGGTGETVLLDEGFEGGWPDGWISYDNDADADTWGVYAESENPGYDIAHSGDMGVGVIYNAAGNDDWLITPPLNLTNFTSAAFGFWARSHSPDYLEDFNVKISTTGNAINNFTTTLGSQTNTPDTWEQYIVDLNAYVGNTIYLAIQCVSVDDWYLFADDFLVLASTGTSSENLVVEDSYKLHNFPNPFNPQTNISFNLVKDERVVVDIYNIKGQKIKNLIHGMAKSGVNTVVWNGRDNDNKPVTSGIYFVKLKTESQNIVRKLILLK